LERRLAAILAADVVGYTRLMGEDEVGTLSRLTELRRETLEPLTAVASFIFRHPADRERLVMWARHAGLPD
jgi:hypothetical protein